MKLGLVEIVKRGKGAAFRLNITIGKNFLGIKNGLKFSIRFINPAYKNVFISIGTNCYPRKMLANTGLKPKRKDGELSYPFDLCFISSKTVLHYLENNFSDFFDDVEYSETKGMWVNSRFGINYPHDNFLPNEKYKFTDRYKKRIANFYNLFKTDKKLYFITVIFDKEFKIDCESINKTYEFFKLKLNGKDFAYSVIRLYDSASLPVEITLNNKIHYEEMLIPIDDYYDLWHISKYKCLPECEDFVNKFADNVYELTQK